MLFVVCPPSLSGRSDQPEPSKNTDPFYLPLKCTVFNHLSQEYKYTSRTQKARTAPFASDYDGIAVSVNVRSAKKQKPGSVRSGWFRACFVPASGMDPAGDPPGRSAAGGAGWSWLAGSCARVDRKLLESRWIVVRELFQSRHRVVL